MNATIPSHLSREDILENELHDLHNEFDQWRHDFESRLVQREELITSLCTNVEMMWSLIKAVKK